MDLGKGPRNNTQLRAERPEREQTDTRSLGEQEGLRSAESWESENGGAQVGETGLALGETAY